MILFDPPGCREISSEDSLRVSLVPDIKEDHYDKKQKRDLPEAYQYSLVAYSSFLSGSVSLAVVIVAASSSLLSVAELGPELVGRVSTITGRLFSLSDQSRRHTSGTPHSHPHNLVTTTSSFTSSYIPLSSKALRNSENGAFGSPLLRVYSSANAVSFSPSPHTSPRACSLRSPRSSWVLCASSEA